MAEPDPKYTVSARNFRRRRPSSPLRKKRATKGSSAGMSIRPSRSTAWTRRWASANRGSARVVLCGGLTGLLTAVVLESYPSTIDYKLVVDAKPVNWATVPAFFPIFFELTVLCSAFAAVGALLVFNQLPKWYHPLFNWERFSRATDDGFFLVIEARDPKFSETSTRAFLEEIGGTHVTLVHD